MALHFGNPDTIDNPSRGLLDRVFEKVEGLQEAVRISVAQIQQNFRDRLPMIKSRENLKNWVVARGSNDGENTISILEGAIHKSPKNLELYLALFRALSINRTPARRIQFDRYFEQMHVNVGTIDGAATGEIEIRKAEISNAPQNNDGSRSLQENPNVGEQTDIVKNLVRIGLSEALGSFQKTVKNFQKKIKAHPMAVHYYLGLLELYARDQRNGDHSEAFKAVVHGIYTQCDPRDVNDNVIPRIEYFESLIKAKKDGTDTRPIALAGFDPMVFPNDGNTVGRTDIPQGTQQPIQVFPAGATVSRTDVDILPIDLEVLEKESYFPVASLNYPTPRITPGMLASQFTEEGDPVEVSPGVKRKSVLILDEEGTDWLEVVCRFTSGPYAGSYAVGGSGRPVIFTGEELVTISNNGAKARDTSHSKVDITL